MDIYYSDKYIFIKDNKNIENILNQEIIGDLKGDYVAILNIDISELLAIIQYEENEISVIIKKIIFINFFNENIISDFVSRFLNQKSIFIEIQNKHIGIGDILQNQYDLKDLISIINM
jgi:hypothetical protein